jgi:hypothetical protein
MGFMTEVSILNDRWGEIRNNPKEFVEQLYLHSMVSGRYRASGYVMGQTEVAPTHHADDVRVYFSGRNSFFDAYPDKYMPVDRLKNHLKYLKEMKNYLKISEVATKDLIAKGETVEVK